MKRYFYVIFYFFAGVLIFYSMKVEAVLPLSGKVIIIDAGHGGVDPGTSYNNILEKDINLSISKYLEEELSKNGASVILIRDGDYDLASPKSKHRKKSDFDNRIDIINNNNANLYISIHLNYLSDSKYYGPQVFYDKSNETLASYIQTSMNKVLKGDRVIKKIPKDTYMYNKIKIDGVLIECGFLSNGIERKNLIKEDYQKKIAYSIYLGIKDYFSN